MDNQFVEATRSKLRFETPRGLISVEDLWDLPLTSKVSNPNLDDIAKSIHSKLKSSDDISFVTPAVKKDDGNALRFEIVKAVIATLVAERDAASQARAKAEQKQKILGILAKKQDSALENSSEEDLRKMLEAL